MKGCWKRLWLLVSVLVLAGSLAGCGIFSGDDDDAIQTDDTPIDSEDDLYVVFEGAGESDSTYGSFEDAEVDSESVLDGNEATTETLTDGDPLVLNMDGISEYETRELTELYYEVNTSEYNSVYFYNSEGWTDLNAYAFGDTYGELYGGWPGSPLMETDETDWHEIGGPVDFADDDFSVIFNADGGEGGQTENIELTSNDGVYIVLDGSTDDMETIPLRNSTTKVTRKLH